MLAEQEFSGLGVFLEGIKLILHLFILLFANGLRRLLGGLSGQGHRHFVILGHEITLFHEHFEHRHLFPVILVPHVVVDYVLFILLLEGVLFLVLCDEGHPGFEALDVGKGESGDNVLLDLPYLLDLHPFELLLASPVLILSAVAVPQLVPLFVYLIPFVLEGLRAPAQQVLNQHQELGFFVRLVQHLSEHLVRIERLHWYFHVFVGSFIFHRVREFIGT